MNVYFMRHGETAWNSEQRLQGSTDIPLCDKGIQLAEETAKRVLEEGISFDACFSSPLTRAKQTAEIMNKAYGNQIVVDERISEICFGEYEGKRIAELRNGQYADVMKAFFVDPSSYHADHGAEDLDHLFLRLKDFWESQILPLEGKKENVLVCAHGAVCRAFLVLLKPLDVSQFWANHQFNCSMNQFEVKNGHPKLICENRIFYDKANVMINPLLEYKEEIKVEE